LVNRGKKTVFKLARKIPAISQRIEREMNKINETFEQEVIHRNQGNPYIMTLPKEGKDHHHIIQQVEQYLSFGKLVDSSHECSFV
jgi:sphinganine-1-phosphate aldolase